MRPHAPPPSSLFVYFKLNGHARTAVHAALSGMQARLRERHPGLSARLMARTDEAHSASGALTWMEVYEHPEGIGLDFLGDLQAEVARLPADLIGPRHTESFTDLGSPHSDPA